MNDTEIFKLIDQEKTRQTDGLELIPSENYVSTEVLKALGSILTNKYSEGYSGKRYYGGNEFVDQIETLAINRAKALFHVPHANVQPYSGSPANFAVYMATCQPGDTIMGLNLSDGGHLTHGWKVSASALFYNSIPYHTKADGRVDLEEVRRLALEHKPKLIWVGGTAYPFQYEFAKFAKIADEVGAYLVADIAHVAGLIVGGVHPDPTPFVHIITSTTHKTLRGPRGGLIMVTDKGLAKDPELSDKIDRAVFPGLQGGPHNHQIAATAVALHEASTPEFKNYAKQIVKNAKTLADKLIKKNVKLVGDGTENHLLLIDLTPTLGPGGGALAEIALEAAGMTANKNTIPTESSSPFFPSGLRLGTPALTSRGMKETEMIKVADWIVSVLDEIKSYRLPEDKNERKNYLTDFAGKIKLNKNIAKIRAEIKDFTKDFPVPGIE